MYSFTKIGHLVSVATWSVPLNKEHRLRVFENRVLKRIFVQKRNETMRGWRKLHKEQLHNITLCQV
jgi:hypothetical protein